MDFTALWALVISLWSVETVLGGMTAGHLIVGGLVMIVCIVARKLFAHFVLARIRRFTKQTKSDLDDKILEALKEPIKFIPIILGVFWFANYFVLPPAISIMVNNVASAMITGTLFWAFFNILSPFSSLLESVLAKLTAESETLFAEEFTGLIVKSLKIGVVVVGAIIVLSQMGLNVYGLLGGLGIFGMAVAFGAQQMIQNIFGGIKILLDGVFKRGEWIQVGDTHGTVMSIGIATTKLRAFDKAIISIPNSIISETEVKNWTRMSNRRIKMTIGVEYRTTYQQLQNIVSRIRDYLINNPEIAQPADHPVAQMVHLVNFGASSIDINIYTFTITTSWAEWRRIQHDCMLEFKRIVEDEGTGFAFPTQTLHIDSMPVDAVDKSIITEDDDVKPYKRIENDETLKRGGADDADEGDGG